MIASPPPGMAAMMESPGMQRIPESPLPGMSEMMTSPRMQRMGFGRP